MRPPLQRLVRIPSTEKNMAQLAGVLVCASQSTVNKWVLGNKHEFPEIHGGTIEFDSQKERCDKLAALHSNKLLHDIDSKPLPPAPKSMEEARRIPDAEHWAKAWDAETDRHDTELNTWTYEDPLPTDSPKSYVLTFKSKTNMYGFSKDIK